MVKYGGVITSTQGTSFNIEKFCFLKTFLSVSHKKRIKNESGLIAFSSNLVQKAIRADYKSRQKESGSQG